jgi:hypothetical protein
MAFEKCLWTWQGLKLLCAATGRRVNTRSPLVTSQAVMTPRERRDIKWIVVAGIVAIVLVLLVMGWQAR